VILTTVGPYLHKFTSTLHVVEAVRSCQHKHNTTINSHEGSNNSSANITILHISSQKPAFFKHRSSKQVLKIFDF